MLMTGSNMQRKRSHLLHRKGASWWVFFQGDWFFTKARGLHTKLGFMSYSVNQKFRTFFYASSKHYHAAASLLLQGDDMALMFGIYFNALSEVFNESIESFTETFSAVMKAFQATLKRRRAPQYEYTMQIKAFVWSIAWDLRITQK